jgi:hypothetical protein
MLGDGLDLDLERLGELVDRGFSGCQAGNDCPSGRVGQGGERGAELIGFHGVVFN